MIINAYNDSWNLKVFFDSRGRGFKFSLLVDVAVASYSLILSRVSQGALRCLPVHIFHDVFQRFLNPRSMFTNVSTVWNCTIYIILVCFYASILCHISRYFTDFTTARMVPSAITRSWKRLHRISRCRESELRYPEILAKRVKKVRITLRNRV